MTFEEAERQYQHLLSQLQAGQISQQGFQQALDKLHVQTADGSWWRIRPKDGSWLRWDGANWVTAVPPHRAAPPGIAASPAAAGQVPRKRRRWWLACSLIALLSICCLALVGGGYLAVRAGSMSAMQLSSQLSGAANVSITNLDDNVLTVVLNQLDVPEEGAGFERERLEPFDIGGFSSLDPGRYQVDFESDGNPLLNLSCTITAENRDIYQFVAVPEGVVITLEGEAVQDPDELDASTSSLCRR